MGHAEVGGVEVVAEDTVLGVGEEVGYFELDLLELVGGQFGAGGRHGKGKDY